MNRSARTQGAVSRRRAALALRPATERDIVPLRFFFDSLLRRDYFVRRRQIEDLVRGPHHRAIIAEIDSVLIGVAVLSRGTTLINVLVHPSYRGRGIGRALVDASRAEEVRAKLDMSTGDPRGFYAALGFEPTGKRNKRGNIELMRRGRIAV